MIALLDALTKTLWFLFVLGVVVVFHEYGHFLAARLVGVRVDVFSFGFGRRLLGWKRGDTDYRVSLIPLGGYVRMAGELSEDGATGAPDEFESKRSWQKLLVLFAGPAFNLILAVGLLAAAHVIGIRVPAFLSQEVRVEAVEPGSPAETAGVMPGDVVRRLDGQPVPDWRRLGDLEAIKPNREVTLEIERDGGALELTARLGAVGPSRLGHLGIHPCHQLRVTAVLPRGAAAEAGLQPDDEIVAVDGRPACASGVLIAEIQRAEGAEQELTILRDGQELRVPIAARWSDVQDAFVIGVNQTQVARSTELVRHGPGSALGASIAGNWRNSKFVVETLYLLVTGKLSLRALSGPLDIAATVAVAAQLGVVQLLQLMALISLNLGILNLLPIPILDGGRIAIVGLEAVRGRELSLTTKEWILRAGFAMIVTLMAVVLFLDVVKKLEG